MKRWKLNGIFLKNPYIKDSAIIFIFSFSGSILNYLYQILCNRNMTKDHYGLLNSLISLLFIVSAFIPILKQWMVKILSEIYVKNAHHQVLGLFKRYYLILAITALAAGLAAKAGLTSYFDNLMKSQNEQGAYFLLILLWATINFANVPIVSFLESYNLFFKRSVAIFAADTLNIAVAGLFIYLLNFNVHLALGAKSISVAGGFLLGVFFAGQTIAHYRKKDTGVNRSEKVKSVHISHFFQIGLGAICLNILLNFDMALIRINFAPELSGNYATISVFGKTLYFIAATTIPLFYVKSSEAYQNNDPVKPLLLKGFAVTTVLATAGYLGLSLFIKPFISLLKPGYLASTPDILAYALAMIPYVYTQMLIVFFMAFNCYKIFWLLALLTLGQILLVSFEHQNIQNVIQIRLISGLCILLVLGLYLLYLKNTAYFNKKSDSHR